MCNHVNRAKHMTDMGKLSQVAYYFLSFTDVWGRRLVCDFLDLGNRVGLSPSYAQEGASVGCDFRSGETSVCMFCGLGKAVKNYVVISWPCTKGSVHGAKGRLSSRLASDEITNLWVKLRNIDRV
jgi:hypothetical protein